MGIGLHRIIRIAICLIKKYVYGFSMASFVMHMMLIGIGGWLVAAPASAAQAIDEAYVRSLAAAGRVVLVVEYYDGQGEVLERKGYATSSAFKTLSGTDFRVHDKMVIHLYGVEPCDGEMVNQRDGFAGGCADYARQQLQIMLTHPKVVFCRAFISEQKASVQNSTCYAYHYFPGSLDSVDMLEEQLVSLGALRLRKKPDGTFVRPDLIKAEQIGRMGSFGMWADPRIGEQ